MPHQVWSLRGHVHRQLARDLVERRHAAAGLERTGMYARIQDLLLDRDRSAGEGRVGGCLVARLPGEDMVRMRARPMPHVVLVRNVLANDRCIGCHRLVRVDDHGQLLVVDLDELRAVRRAVAIAEHHRHFLHLEADLLVRQHRLHVTAERRHPVQVDRLQVVRGQHRHDTRHRQRLRLVDRLDAGMGIGTAHHGAEQHARQLDVVDVGSPAADEPRVLLAQARTAQSLQLVLRARS